VAKELMRREIKDEETVSTQEPGIKQENMWIKEREGR
jgi:hypothetical protein